MLEATEYYHRGLVTYLKREEYSHYIVNPLQSKRLSQFFHNKRLKIYWKICI
ncbi:transposase family protein [Paenibacillus macerans]|uniref:Transposase family protein n=1 Tax=Paenibacillus macerans TaxID=44252 RepID=A0A090ZNS8_PAEMA|nr:transposase family protein [Paenibacillus macerans]